MEGRGREWRERIARKREGRGKRRPFHLPLSLPSNSLPSTPVLFLPFSSLPLEVGPLISS